MYFFPLRQIHPKNDKGWGSELDIFEVRPTYPSCLSSNEGSFIPISMYSFIALFQGAASYCPGFFFENKPGGPCGQLATHPGLAQFLLDNACTHRYWAHVQGGDPKDS